MTFPLNQRASCCHQTRRIQQSRQERETELLITQFKFAVQAGINPFSGFHNATEHLNASDVVDVRTVPANGLTDPHIGACHQCCCTPAIYSSMPSTVDAFWSDCIRSRKTRSKLVSWSISQSYCVCHWSRSSNETSDRVIPIRHCFSPSFCHSS